MPLITAKLIIETKWGVLLIKDRIDKKGRYSLPGGIYDKKQDKSYEAAAIRELYEELGLVVTKIKSFSEKVPMKPVWDKKAKRKKRRVGYIYVAQVRNWGYFFSLKRNHFDYEVEDIGFLTGKKKVPLQGHVKYVVENYVKTKDRKNYRQKYFSNITISKDLLIGWE